MTKRSNDESEGNESAHVGIYIPPPMTPKAYAELQGVSEETVINQMRKGHIPSIKTGKRRMVNTYAVAAGCLSAD